MLAARASSLGLSKDYGYLVGYMMGGVELYMLVRTSASACVCFDGTDLHSMDLGLTR